MRGLDPRIHDETPLRKTYETSLVWNAIMDCRVKPGNDSGEGVPADKVAGFHSAAATRITRHCANSARSAAGLTGLFSN